MKDVKTFIKSILSPLRTGSGRLKGACCIVDESANSGEQLHPPRNAWSQEPAVRKKDIARIWGEQVIKADRVSCYMNLFFSAWAEKTKRAEKNVWPPAGLEPLQPD